MMGIHVIWDDDITKQTIRFIYEGTWTWDENYRAIDESTPMFDSKNDTVDLIVDMTTSMGYPPGNVLSHFRQIADRYHERAGHNVVISNNAFLRMMSDTFNRIYQPQKIKGKTFFAKDLTEARQILDRYRKIRDEVEKTN